MLCLHRSLSGNGFQRRRSLTYRVHVFTGRRLSHNQLNSRLVLFITHRHGHHWKHLSEQLFYCCVAQLSHGRRRENGLQVSSLLPVRNLLPSNGRCLLIHYLATAQHATIFCLCTHPAGGIENWRSPKTKIFQVNSINSDVFPGLVGISCYIVVLRECM
jgi:hypothetical protein